MRLPRNAQLWLPGWWRTRRLPRPPAGTGVVWLTITDHFEPRWNAAELPVARSRVTRWSQHWPGLAEQHRDHFGRQARYSFFFPQEEYDPSLLDPLAEMTRQGVADVEVHIHHDGEGETDFRDRISRFVADLRGRHDLLHEVNGRPGFAFIHGNWALDNARPDGRWCGLNNELTILRELGCYADFTNPAAPDPCQTRRVNSIYWAVDDPAAPKSHDDGVEVVPGGTPPASALLMVQGPLTIRWPADRWPRPALEVGELAGQIPVTANRVAAWLRVAPRVGDHLFVKLHAHGAPEKNAGPLLERDLSATLTLLRAACERRGWRLAHATAWEAFRAIEAIRAGDDPIREVLGSVG